MKKKKDDDDFQIITVVGNRPQFIKMAPISYQLNLHGYKELIIHTGQHFDENMSAVFFEELGIPEPDIHLNIGAGSHGKMTGSMLIELEQILEEKKPNGLLIYGDTNSTLAAALAAVKLHIPIAHVESGPRIYDINTPEEINRIVADHAARFRFCPDLVSVQNLAKENITKGVYLTGDVMYDSYLIFSKVAKKKSSIIKSLGLEKEKFALLTVHRPNNTDTFEALIKIIELLRNTNMKVIFPIHPRTEAALKKFGFWEELKDLHNVITMPAVGYLNILELVNNSRIVLTDSGGLQKEAFYAGKPVLILFYTTPWPEIEACGWQKCCWKDNGIDVSFILNAMELFSPVTTRPNLFGDGMAAVKIVNILESNGWFKR